MKIKLIRYPYKEYEIGDVLDLGKEKNKSMVSLQRAVWYDPQGVEHKQEDGKKLASKPPKEAEQEVEEAQKKALLTSKLPAKTGKKKKFLQNKLRDKILEKKTEKSNGFWDKLR